MVELTEQEIYMYSQAGVTLYRDLIKVVFSEGLKNHMPERVLPVSSEPPRDLHAMVDTDFKEIKKLFRPKTRRGMEAKSKLKSLVIIEASLEGARSQPSELEMNKLAKEVQKGRRW